MKTRLPALALCALGLAVATAAEPDKGFVAHEWGTFTSVQGGDGVQMIWNPLVAPELPSFVYDRDRVTKARIPGILVAGKTKMATRQRMETPVIYFYSDQALTLDVAVNFPEGNITEWYPQESALNGEPTSSPTTGASQSPADLQLQGGTAFALLSAASSLHWKHVEVLPHFACSGPLPTDQTSSHYYAARETDASELSVRSGDKMEFEKFLFYRGVASFEAPLTVKLDPADAKRVILTNSGTENLDQIFVYEVRQGGGAWLGIKNLRPGESRTVTLDPASGARPIGASDLSLDQAVKVSSPRLNTSLVDALVGEGLYAREAAAMVRTWESSWFGEPGLRVLYTLPRAWTDRKLPLAIQPAPKAIERVMVARAEVITPAMEKALSTEVERYVAAKSDERSRIVEETRALRLGRFIGPTMNRLTTSEKRSQEFNAYGWELVDAAMAPVKPVNRLTAK